MFKKILGILITSVVFCSSASAQDLSAMCAAPYDMSWKSTRFLTTVTGMTFLSQSIANSIIRNELKKATGSKGLKAKMKSFSANDLAAGRFKSLKIYGKNLDFNGVYVSKFNADTICDFNYVKASKKSVLFKENFAMNYSLSITDDDLKKTVLSKDYLSFLHSLNIKIGGLNLLELNNVDVKFKDDKFHFILEMSNSMFSYKLPLNLHVSSKMKVVNGQIKVTEVALEDKNQKINLSQITNMLNLINPLNFTVDIMGNKKTKMAVKNIDIKGDTLIVDGTLFIPKNTIE